jgi:hypothetical protein
MKSEKMKSEKMKSEKMRHKAEQLKSTKDTKRAVFVENVLEETEWECSPYPTSLIPILRPMRN